MKIRELSLQLQNLTSNITDSKMHRSQSALDADDLVRKLKFI